MTISNQTTRISAVGAGAVLAIPYSFSTTQSGDLTVIQRVISTGVSTTLAETTDYTATYGESGGTVTTINSIAATDQVHVIRRTPRTQTLDLVQGGSFNAENIEDATDKNTKLINENYDRSTRTAKFPDTDPSSSIGDFPNSIDRLSKTLTFDSNGKPTASSTNTSTTVSYSTIGTNIAEAADAATVRGLIGTNIDVEDYGAVGDGVTDDTAALADAFAAADGQGKKVIFHSGEYLISSALTLPTDCIIEGTGTGAGTAVIQLSDSASDAVHVLTKTYPAVTSNSARILIRNLRIKGNWDGVTAAGTGNGIHLQYVFTVILDNVKIEDCTDAGLYFSRPSYFYMNNIAPRSNRVFGLEIEDHGGTDGSTTVQIRGRSIFNGNDNAATASGGAIKATKINNFTIDGAVFESNNTVLRYIGGNEFSMTNCYTENQTSDDTLMDFSGSSSVRRLDISNNYLGGKIDAIQLIKGLPNPAVGDTIGFMNNHIVRVALQEPEDFTVLPDVESYNGSGTFLTSALATPATIVTFIMTRDTAGPTTGQGSANFVIGICGMDRSDGSKASSQIVNLHIAYDATNKLKVKLHTGVTPVSYENASVYYENEQVTIEGAMTDDFGANINLNTSGWSNAQIVVKGDRTLELQITPADASGTSGRVWWRGGSHIRVSSKRTPIRIQAWTIVETGGQQDGGDDKDILTDSGESWTPDEHIGKYVFNTTDNSFGLITDNDATTITATLEAGTDDDWDDDDFYEIRTFNR